MKKRSLRHDCRGQVLIVSALLVALLLLSTAIYVIEVSKDVPTVEADITSNFESYQPSLRCALISALANVTNGGSREVLASDLSDLKTVILARSYQALLTIEYSPLNGGVYQDGFWVSSGGSGEGVSSVYVSFAFNASNSAGYSHLVYSVNVTSRMDVSGNYQQVNDTHRQVTLNLKYSNEAGAALAQNQTFSYQNGADWVPADSTLIVDHGDGTYTVSFYAEMPSTGEVLNVSASCWDQRGICIKANVACNRIT
ncbi:MAG: hypothetical protein M1540_06860 [Candidatus Bathyarchaeota archaeon]|nr:hypothetical protein [Candidatus Bathyarchaeota archaeon]